MDVVRVFLRDRTVKAGGYLTHIPASLPVGRENDIASPLLVYLIVNDIAHPIVASCQLCQLGCATVIQIEMRMPIAVTLPEYQFRREVAAQIARIGHILVIALLNQCPDVSL